MAVKNDRITFSYLKRLNEEIKSNNPIRQNKAYQALSEINHNGLNPGLLMYIYYLQGKYHYLDFKRDDNLKSIAAAVECYRLVFQTARQHRVFAKNPKYYFKYANFIFLSISIVNFLCLIYKRLISVVVVLDKLFNSYSLAMRFWFSLQVWHSELLLKTMKDFFTFCDLSSFS